MRIFQGAVKNIIAELLLTLNLHDFVMFGYIWFYGGTADTSVKRFLSSVPGVELHLFSGDMNHVFTIT